MKTTLPAAITTRAEAEQFLQSLIDNNETYHPEDNAHDIIWDMPEDQKPTPAEADQLNKLMEDIYNLDGNNGNHASPKFDPCEYLNNAKGKDLFEDYENLPDNVKSILEKYGDKLQSGDYRDLEAALAELTEIGYTFEYYLDGTAYNLQKI